MVVKWPLYRSFIPRLNACLPVGEWSREYFLYYGAKAANLFVVPHVVDTERLSLQTEALIPRRSALRQAWGFSEEDVVFLFVGKFIPKKRPEDLIRAVVEIAQTTPRISALMVGDGSLRSTCEEMVRQDTPPIRFTGFLNQTEIARAYVVADALVLPSDGGETWGLVVNEAMACGRPCFVTDEVGCGPDLIDEGRTGAIFPCGDVTTLAALLKRYASRPILKLMGEYARERISAYTPRVAAGRLVEAIQYTVARSRCRVA